jgi:membrane protein implicated in regulation of membrane protease activity
VRGEALAGLFLAAYAGLAVPVVGLGVATQLLSARDAVLGFAAVLAAVVAVVSRGLLRQRARQPGIRAQSAGEPGHKAAAPGGRAGGRNDPNPYR